MCVCERFVADYNIDLRAFNVKAIWPICKPLKRHQWVSQWASDWAKSKSAYRESHVYAVVREFLLRECLCLYSCHRQFAFWLLHVVHVQFLWWVGRLVIRLHWLHSWSVVLFNCQFSWVCVCVFSLLAVVVLLGDVDFVFVFNNKIYDTTLSTTTMYEQRR